MSVVGVGPMVTSAEVEACISPLNNVPVPASTFASDAFSSMKKDGVGVRIDVKKGLLE